MLIRPTEEEAANFGEPDFTIFNSGQFLANKLTPGMTSGTSIALSFDRKEMVILGSQYAGEMKVDLRAHLIQWALASSKNVLIQTFLIM